MQEWLIPEARGRVRHILVEMRKSSTCSGGDGLERKAGSQGPELASVEEAESNVGTGGDDFGLVENAVLPVGEVGCIY